MKTDHVLGMNGAMRQMAELCDHVLEEMHEEIRKIEAYKQLCLTISEDASAPTSAIEMMESMTAKLRAAEADKAAAKSLDAAKRVEGFASIFETDVGAGKSTRMPHATTLTNDDQRLGVAAE